MPAATAMQPAHAGNKSNAPALLVPFTRASREYCEPFMDVAQTLGTSSTQLPQQDIPAYGFLRGIHLDIQASGGTGTVAVAGPDAPWSSIQEIVLKDVNGAPIVGPVSGYDLYLINKFGGYFPHQAEPKLRPSFAAVGTNGNYSFGLYIPVELSQRDALGAIANQNAASTYKLQVTMAPAAQVYNTAPTTAPTVRVRATLEAWTQPTQADLRGNAQSVMPPAHGTTQYWSKTVINVTSGMNTIRLPRVGNYIRNLILVARDASGARAAMETAIPDPLTLNWDTRLLRQYIRPRLNDQVARRYMLTAGLDAAQGRDSAVIPLDFMHEFDGIAGNELRDGWLPTTQSTRLELAGSFGAAGTLTVLTNDVAPQGEIFV